jgi:mRNA deadenylase 3'-5' endonuclease subunit Ccr4
MMATARSLPNSMPTPRVFLERKPQAASAAAAAAPDAASPSAAVAVPLSVASYNLLAQGLVRREVFFPYASKSELKAKYRQTNLIAELKTSDADVICAQEMDFFEVYDDAMTKAGYQSVFVTEGRRENQHGVAVFFKTAKCVPPSFLLHLAESTSDD